MAAVRIDGPDSTRQWRVVRSSDGDVLMDGFGTAIEAVRWAKTKKHKVAPSAKLVAAMAEESKVTRKIPRSRNPQLLTIGNPARGDMAQAVAAYTKFHGVAPRPADIVKGGGKGILVALGELRRIDYKPRRGERKSPTWFHHFKPGCVLCATPDGRRLVILDREAKRLVDFARGIIR